MMDNNNNSSSSSDDDDYEDDNNYNIRRGSGIINDATMMSSDDNDTANNTSNNYYRCCDPVESPLVTHTEETFDEMNNNEIIGNNNATIMESPITAMTPSAVAPSPFFSPTTNALNQSLIQHAESLVDATTTTPLERVETGVMDVMERLLGSAFSSVKKRTLGGGDYNNRQYPNGFDIAEEEEERMRGGSEETIVLDVAAAYMARLTRDGLYENDDDNHDNNEEEDDGHSNHMYDNQERIGVDEFEQGNVVGVEETTVEVPHSPPSIPVEEEVDDCGDESNNQDESRSHEESNMATFVDSCYHEDGNNIHDGDANAEEEDDLDSYYICNAAGFCSSESVDDSSISETASEEEEDDDYEEDFFEEGDEMNDDNKSCSLDLTGIEKIMNLDDTLPSVIPKIQLCQSNSDVDLSGIDEVMNLDDTLPLEDHCVDETDVNDRTVNFIDGDVGQAEPSFDNNEKCHDDIVPSSNGAVLSVYDDKEDDNDTAPSNGHIVQDEPSLQNNDEGDDDFIPSALKEMISQQESQISSLLGSITNMQSTPGRIKKLEARLLGEEDDEDAGLNGIVDMTNAEEVGLTPVKRRLELVEEEEVEIESAGKARMKQNALFKSGLEPELGGGELQEGRMPSTASQADNEATPIQPSMELEVDKAEQEAVASPQTTTASPGISADSSEATYKSPWLSFISRQSPLSQPQETIPTSPDVHEEEVEEQTVQEPQSNLTSSEDLVSEHTEESEKLDTSADQIIPTDTSKTAENEVPDSILQMFADADNALQNVLESSVLLDMNTSPAVKNALESIDSDVDSLELNAGAEYDNVDDPTSTMCDVEKVDEPAKCDEVEMNEAELMSDSLSEEKKIGGIQNSINSDEEVKEPEPLIHAASSEAIGSVVKMTTEDFQVAEPSLTGEEPTLECLRGAFLAAESKLEAESKVPASILPESRASAEEEGHTDSTPSDDNKSDSSSAVNDTFETANFSLGDIEKAANEHFFYDAEDDMKDGESSVYTASETNLNTAAEEEDRMSPASFENTLPSDSFKPSEKSCAEEDSVKPSGDGNIVDKLDESTSSLVNDRGDKNQVDAIVMGRSPVDSLSPKLSSSASDESVLNESMFMPNAEAASPPLIAEESLPSVAADTHRTLPEEEYESEDGDDDEDFFPNRDLHSSSNAPKESVQAEATSSAVDKISNHGLSSSKKHDTKNVMTGTEKEPSSRLPKLPKRPKFGSKSSASSKHDRLSASASKGGKLKDSALQTRQPRVRVRAKKSAIPAEGKENNTVERSSKDNSFGASKKSSYSMGRLERLSKPRRQSMIPEPSPVKQQGFNKVASINRLSRLAQPRRQSVVPSNSPKSPVQKRAPQKASIDRLSQLAQPKRQSVAPLLSPVKQKGQQKVAAGTPSFVRRSKQMPSKPTAKSTEEMEQEEMSQFKPFKAKPLNGREVPSRFKTHDRKPPRVNTAIPAPETNPRPPAAVKAPSSRLYQPSPRRHKVLTFGESQQSYLNNGLRSQPPLSKVSTKLTTPKPFALSTRTNITKAPPASSDEIELQKKFKAKPYPFPRRNNMSFSQPKSSEELELEECRKQFKALQLPASVSTTKIDYSSTPIPYHIKAQQQYEMAMERKQRIADESQETVSFKARPVPRSTYEARKVTRQSTGNNARTVVARPPRLSLASRAEERKLFDEHARELREKDAQIKEDILRQQKEWEEEELKQKRMTSAKEGGMCFKAREIHIEYM